MLFSFFQVFSIFNPAPTLSHRHTDLSPYNVQYSHIKALRMIRILFRYVCASSLSSFSLPQRFLNLLWGSLSLSLILWWFHCTHRASEQKCRAPYILSKSDTGCKRINSSFFGAFLKTNSNKTLTIFHWMHFQRNGFQWNPGSFAIFNSGCGGPAVSMVGLWSRVVKWKHELCCSIWKWPNPVRMVWPQVKEDPDQKVTGLKPGTSKDFSLWNLL